MYRYVSLPRTPLSANTVIYNSACVIVFCLSIVILGEKVSILKVSLFSIESTRSCSFFSSLIFFFLLLLILGSHFRSLLLPSHWLVWYLLLFWGQVKIPMRRMRRARSYSDIYVFSLACFCMQSIKFFSRLVNSWPVSLAVNEFSVACSDSLI